MNYWYKDRDFPEIKTSNSDIVAVVPNPKDIERLINEHNDTVDRALELRIALAEAIDELTKVHRYFNAIDGVNARNLYGAEMSARGAVRETVFKKFEKVLKGKE